MVHEAHTTLEIMQIGLFIGTFLLAGAGTLLILWGTVWRGGRVRAA